MAEADILVKVGADITGFLSKIDQAQAKVNQLTEEQSELKTVVKELNALLRINERELAVTTAKLQNLNTTTVRGAAAARVLGKQIALLSNDSKTLKSALLGAQSSLATTTTQLKASAVALKQAQAGTGAFASGVGKAFTGLRTLANIIPGLGISTLILLVSGPIIEAFKMWHSSVNSVSDATKQLKINTASLNNIFIEGNKEAGKEITSLKILYQAATNLSLSMNDRLTAAKALNAEYPKTFGNFTAEEIALGKAQKAYESLIVSVLKLSRAKAAKDKLDVLESKRLDIDVERQKILAESTKEIAAAQAKLGTGSQIVGGLGVTAASQGLTKQEVIATIAANRELRLGVLEEKDKLLKGEQEFLAKYIDVKDLLKVIIKPPETPGKSKAVKDVETVNSVIADMRLKLEALRKEGEFFGFDTSLEKIKLVSGTVKTLLKDLKLETDDPHILALDFEFGVAERGKLREELSKILPRHAAIPVTLTLAPSSAVFPVFQQLEKQVLPEVEKLNQQIAATLENGLENALAGMGEAIGNAISGGGDIGKAIFGTLLQSIATALKELGKGMIALGNLKMVLENIGFTPGIGTVIAGIAAVAAGQLLQASLPKFAVGGPVQGPGTRTSDSILARLSKGEFVISADAVSKFGAGFFEMINRGFMPRGMNQGGSVGSSSIGGGQLVQVVGEFEIRGDRLVAVVQRAQNRINRNG